MTDDLEPTEAHHPSTATAVVRSPRWRAGGALMALILVIGLLGAFVVGRISSAGSDEDFVDTSGAANRALAGGEGDVVADGLSSIDYVGPPLDLVGQRTTDEGIELIVRTGGLDPGVGCIPDRVVRVGILASDALVGSVLAYTYAPGVASPGSLRLTGLAEGRPVLVGIVRTSEGEVTARFPNGTVDTAAVQDGVAVVAAFASPGLGPDELLASSIEIIEAPEGTPTTIDGTLPTPVCNGETQPPPSEPVEKPALPAPGEQPTDPATAEEQVRTAYTEAFDYENSQDEKAEFIERPEVWRDANQQLLDGPYGDVVKDLHAEVDEVVFTAPDHASVRFQLISSDERVPRYQIGDAVLVDGRWRVAITTPCDLLTLASVTCDMSL